MPDINNIETGTQYHWHSKPVWMTLGTVMIHWLSGLSLNDVLTNVSLAFAIICGLMTAIINLPKFLETIKKMRNK